MRARYTLTPEQAKLVIAGLVQIFAFAPRYNIGPGRRQGRRNAMGHPVRS